MNDFIRLRKDYLNHNDDSRFPLAYLEKFQVSQKASEKEKLTVERLKVIFQLQHKKEPNQLEMINLLSYLGANNYVNAYIVALFIKNASLLTNGAFKRQVIDLITTDEVADSTVYALLDCCIECQCDWFDKETLLTLLAKEKQSLDTFSIIIDYIHHFRKEGLEEQITTWLADDFPVAIQIQLIGLYVELYSIEKLVKNVTFSQENQPILDNYIRLLVKDNKYAIEGFTILQSMFYGDFENSGKGNNGGLAIFMKNLGKELSKSDEIGLVVTLAVTKEWTAKHSIVTEYSRGHLFLNIPMYIDKSNSTEFLKKEYFIKRMINRFLEKLALKPDVYHIRFLDNASRAIARLSEEQDKKLVVTLAPDPHRNMINQQGNFNLFSFDELIEKLNKILLGDELIFRSDKIVGIGSRVVKEELEQYFPQLREQANLEKVRMISEGIQTDISLIKQEEKAITTNDFEEMGLTKSFLEKPIILNVGRLNKLKAQDQLLKAWIHSELSASYNLLIVGGDLQHPNSEEQEIIDIFNEQLDKNEQQKNHFLHLSALSNHKVRKLEQKIRAEQKDYPQIYLCSSKKEEFGIAILEALSQGFLVLAPKKGGVKSYLKDGENGFLIDTTDWKSIAEATENIIHSLKNNKEKTENIQLAGEKTVKDNFSMAIITADFLSLYLSLQEME